jgi:hypothetical protein
VLVLLGVLAAQVSSASAAEHTVGQPHAARAPASAEDRGDLRREGTLTHRCSVL